MVSLTFYGGVNEIGGNKILLEDGGTRLFFDFGTSFGKRYQYFEEYLKPRPLVGLLDLLEMGLLPPLPGIYRSDLAPSAELWPRFESSPLYREFSIDAVLLSHAHMDHCGYISFLREDIPIYTTAMTAFISKAIQDSGRSDFEKEVCYSIPKELVDGVVQASNWQKAPARQRLFRVLDHQSFTSAAWHFWQDTPGGRMLQAQPLEPADRIGPLSIRYFPVDHSIFGAAAFAVETSSGWVVYTGDLRLHGGKGHLTEEFIEAAAKLKPAVLLCEGTSVGSSTVTSEDEVLANASAAVNEAEALVIADFGPRNVERLLTFRQVAQETDRRLVILARDAYLLKAMRHISPEIPGVESDPVIWIYKDAKAHLDRWEREVRSDNHSKLVTPEEIRRCQDSYILSFSFFDINDLPDLAPQPGSIYIYSSSEAHNEEQELDLWRLHNWLDHFGMKGVGLPLEQLKWEIPEEEQGLHASGHASGPELLNLIQRISPRTLIPIHTQDPWYFVQGLEGTGIEVRPPAEGQTMAFP